MCDWSKGESLKQRKRFLLVAALSVGIAFATPAMAGGPTFKMNNAWAKNHAKNQIKFYGWKQPSQWACLVTLWHRESGWRLEAQNKTAVRILKNGKWIKVYAGGIPQILGMSPKTPAPTQIQRGLNYIKVRYGSPCKALRFWDIKKYY